MDMVHTMNDAWKKWFTQKTKKELIQLAWELHLENNKLKMEAFE